MIEVYSANVTAEAGSAVPLNTVTFKKGCTATLSGAATIALNKLGIYNVKVNASCAAASTIQLYVNGVAQAQTLQVGTNPSIDTLVEVKDNGCGCNCCGFTGVQIVNAGDAAETFTNLNVVVTKLGR